MALFFDEDVNKPLPFISYFELSATTEEEHPPVTTAVEETPVGSSSSFEEESKDVEFEAEKTIGSETNIGDEDTSGVLPFISSFELPVTVSEDTTNFLPPKNTTVVAEETYAHPVHVQEIVLETRTAERSVSADVERREEICVHRERDLRAQPMHVNVVNVSNATPTSFDEFEHGRRNADSGYLDTSSIVT